MPPGNWAAIPDTDSGGQHTYTFSLSLSGARQFLRLNVTAVTSIVAGAENSFHS